MWRKISESNYFHNPSLFYLTRVLGLLTYMTILNYPRVLTYMTVLTNPAALTILTALT